MLLSIVSGHGRVFGRDMAFDNLKHPGLQHDLSRCPPLFDSAVDQFMIVRTRVVLDGSAAKFGV
jgi:hypothetical protein